MDVKNQRPISISSASVAFSSPNTSYRAVNYAAFSMFKALILPLLNGYDTVSQPLMACIPGKCRHLEPSNKHVALISITTPFQRSIWTAECSCIFQTQYGLYPENKDISIIGESVLLIFHFQQLAVDSQSLSHLPCHARSHRYSDCQLTCLHPCQGWRICVTAPACLLCLFLRMASRFGSGLLMVIL